jgi:hypothetical protein
MYTELVRLKCAPPEEPTRSASGVGTLRAGTPFYLPLCRNVLTRSAVAADRGRTALARMAPRARAADARRGCARRPGQYASEDPCTDVSTATSRSADSTSPPSTPAWRSGLKAWLMTVLCILVAVGCWCAKARTWARRLDRSVASPAPQEGATLQLLRRVAAKAGKLWQLQHMLVLLATSAGGCASNWRRPVPMP